MIRKNLAVTTALAFIACVGPKQVREHRQIATTQHRIEANALATDLRYCSSANRSDPSCSKRIIDQSITSITQIFPHADFEEVRKQFYAEIVRFTSKSMKDARKAFPRLTRDTIEAVVMIMFYQSLCEISHERNLAIEREVRAELADDTELLYIEAQQQASENISRALQTLSAGTGFTPR